MTPSEEHEQVEAWRFDYAMHLGYAPSVVTRLAAGNLRHVDLHELERLIERSCPPKTALRIMA